MYSQCNFSMCSCGSCHEGVLGLVGAEVDCAAVNRKGGDHGTSSLLRCGAYSGNV